MALPARHGEPVRVEKRALDRHDPGWVGHQVVRLCGPISLASQPSTQQRQHALWALVGLRDHRVARLLQDVGA
jgi:hypothetical protein